MSNAAATNTTDVPAPKRKRIESLDAFRGLTILGMVFVIAVAAGGYWKEIQNPLPHTTSWMGSLPVSTWFHADMGFEIWEHTQQEKGLTEHEIHALPEYEDNHARRYVGVTATDLIAPWFVFIVGVCIPLSRKNRGDDWWRHATSRTIMLILAGILYISLVLRQVTWWWGVLQAIGIAYFCGCALMRIAPPRRLPVILAIAAANLLLTELWPPWTEALRSQTGPFGTLTNPTGNWLKPLIVHCVPWLSISYGVMTMIGVLVGEAVATGDPKGIIRRGLTIGAGFTLAGLIIHIIGMATHNYSLACDKPNVSTSYAFFTAGLGALTYILFYWIIDVKGLRAWSRPLVVFGLNPLVAYFMMIVMRRAIMDDLGLTDVFNRTTGDNALVSNWATWIGGGEPSQAILAFFDKGGWMGVFWGLAWTLCLWLIVAAINKRGWFWKL